jgi:DNA end-binding protein Ku
VVPADEIDKRYYERPYYVVPDDKNSEQAFAVIRDALKNKDRVALAVLSLPTGSTSSRLKPSGRACSRRR